MPHFSFLVRLFSVLIDKEHNHSSFERYGVIDLILTLPYQIEHMPVRRRYVAQIIDGLASNGEFDIGLWIVDCGLD